MTTGLYHHLREAWKKPTREMLQSRMIQWRASEAVTEVEKPLRLDRARSLGYKAKPGFFVVRVRIRRGGRKRSRHTHGRKSRKQHVMKVLKMNYQWVAELRAAAKHSNMVILNSYLLAKDGKHAFYEVIMVDPQHPVIKADPVLNWASDSSQRSRVHRGLTSAGKKSRGLRVKGPNRKVRPSVRAWERQGK
jgi:large subunit ribosomal protein L15e